MDDAKIVHYRCPGCGRAQSCAVMPWHGVTAKAKCRICDYVSELQVRESIYPRLDEHCEEGKDIKRTAKKTSVNVQINERVRKELAAMRAARYRHAKRIRTPFGDGILIG